MKQRKDCFFGLHFDAHAEKNQKNVGKDLKIEELEYLFSEVKPDFVQCDSKGHPGIATFQSKLGTTVQFYQDTMQVWREVSAKYGVALFAHYSGVFDSAAVQARPEWAITEKNGEISQDYTSTLSPYADELLIPQLKELAGIYGLNGAWVDGECWAALADYSEKTKILFEERTGLKFEENAKAFAEFCRHYESSLCIYGMTVLTFKCCSHKFLPLFYHFLPLCDTFYHLDVL